MCVDGRGDQVCQDVLVDLSRLVHLKVVVQWRMASEMMLDVEGSPGVPCQGSGFWLDAMIAVFTRDTPGQCPWSLNISALCMKVVLSFQSSILGLHNSRTWIKAESSCLVCSDSPPRTKILSLIAHMVWPLRGLATGPTFWNKYHRRSIVLENGEKALRE